MRSRNSPRFFGSKGATLNQQRNPKDSKQNTFQHLKYRLMKWNLKWPFSLFCFVPSLVVCIYFVLMEQLIGEQKRGKRHVEQISWLRVASFANCLTWVSTQKYGYPKMDDLGGKTHIFGLTPTCWILYCTPQNGSNMIWVAVASTWIFRWGRPVEASTAPAPVINGSLATEVVYWANGDGQLGGFVLGMIGRLVEKIRVSLIFSCSDLWTIYSLKLTAKAT